MNIPEAAVDAAYARIWPYTDDPEEEVRDMLRMALEAAAPYMLPLATKCCGNYSPTPCHGCD